MCISVHELQYTTILGLILTKKTTLPSVQFFDYSLALTIFLGRFCLVSYCQFPSRTRHRVYQGLLFSVPKLCLYTMLQKNWFTLLTERISSYKCTCEVWRALKRLRHEQLLRFSKALECALSMNQLINVCTRHDDIHIILNEVLLLPFSVTFRTVFSFLSGVFIYATAWGLLGLDSGDASGPNSPPYLTVRSFPPNRFRSNILQ